MIGVQMPVERIYPFATGRPLFLLDRAGYDYSIANPEDGCGSASSLSVYGDVVTLFRKIHPLISLPPAVLDADDEVGDHILLATTFGLLHSP